MLRYLIMLISLICIILHAHAELTPQEKQEFAERLYQCGVIYENGQGVIKNTNIALEFYQQAASLGHSGSIAILNEKYPKTIVKPSASHLEQSVVVEAKKYNESVFTEDNLIKVKILLSLQGTELDSSNAHWGDNEFNAVVVFQKSLDLTPDGKIGPQTLSKMNQMVEVLNNGGRTVYPITSGSKSNTSNTVFKAKASTPSVAENGDVKGIDNDGDGRTESVHVNGYYRKDGTYVRGHYRASPN